VDSTIQRHRCPALERHRPVYGQQAILISEVDLQPFLDVSGDQCPAGTICLLRGSCPSSTTPTGAVYQITSDVEGVPSRRH